MTINIKNVAIVGLVVYIIFLHWIGHKKDEIHEQDTKAIVSLQDSLVKEINLNGQLIARTKEISITHDAYKLAKEKEFEELKSKYGKISNVRYITTFGVKHDTVYNTDTVILKDGVQYFAISDSCMDLQGEIESGNLSYSYNLAPLRVEIIGVWKKEGKWPFKKQVPYVDTRIVTECGKVEYQQAVTFDKPKKSKGFWWGLGIGVTVGLLVR